MIPLVLTDNAVTSFHKIFGVGATLVEQRTSHQVGLSVNLLELKNSGLHIEIAATFEFLERM